MRFHIVYIYICMYIWVRTEMPSPLREVCLGVCFGGMFRGMFRGVFRGVFRGMFRGMFRGSLSCRLKQETRWASS